MDWTCYEGDQNDKWNSCEFITQYAGTNCYDKIIRTLRGWGEVGVGTKLSVDLLN